MHNAAGGLQNAADDLRTGGGRWEPSGARGHQAPRPGAAACPVVSGLGRARVSCLNVEISHTEDCHETSFTPGPAARAAARPDEGARDNGHLPAGEPPQLAFAPRLAPVSRAQPAAPASWRRRSSWPGCPIVGWSAASMYRPTSRRPCRPICCSERRASTTSHASISSRSSRVLQAAPTARRSRSSASSWIAAQTAEHIMPVALTTWQRTGKMPIDRPMSRLGLAARLAAWPVERASQQATAVLERVVGIADEAFDIGSRPRPSTRSPRSCAWRRHVRSHHGGPWRRSGKSRSGTLCSPPALRDHQD